MNDTPALRIQDLTFRYGPPGPDAPLVVDVRSLRLAPGEQMLLTGGSGTGKSTLLSIIAGLMDPTGGAVEVAGADVHAAHGAARDRLRGRRIGMIFQTFNLLHGFSALENVLAALMFSDVPPKEHRARASDLLARLGIERVHATPERLSVGQQQRVAVARAVVCRPALVLADEPTASLDPENSAGAMDVIQAACREAGAALLCVSHDPSMTSRFPLRRTLAELRTAPTLSAQGSAR